MFTSGSGHTRLVDASIVPVVCFSLASFCLANVSPQAPQINEPQVDGQQVNPEDVHMEAGPFIDPDGGDSHQHTDWEIWQNEGVIERVWFFPVNGLAPEAVHTHLADGTFENSHSGRTSLIPETQYRLRVRFRDDSGDAGTAWSPWSERAFVTGPLSAVFPLDIEDIVSNPGPVWQDAQSTAPVELPDHGIDPPVVRLESGSGQLGGQLFLSFTGQAAAGNALNNPATLAGHFSVRVVIDGGATGLTLPETDLTFTDDDGDSHTILLPQVNLDPDQVLVLWVAINGTTFFGDLAQAEPVFGSLARGVSVPWVVEEGYQIDIVASGFQLPVAIAFVPNPGSDPNDPYYYVAELYGKIKVVRRNGVISDYATGLLNFNPTGNFPGSGEPGVASILVDPDNGDLYATRVTSSIPFNDGAPHHPQVIRLSSSDGGLTASSTTVLLNMPGETQGQSHQVSNISLGPDDKLYVHNGDGFNAATAQTFSSYRGKVLRMNKDGSAAADNPFYDASNGISSRDYVFARGFRNPFGGAWRSSDQQHYAVENGPSLDRIVIVTRGNNYDWNGNQDSLLADAIFIWNPATAPVNNLFLEAVPFSGSGFPSSKLDHMFVTLSGPTYATGAQSRGKRIEEFVFDGNGNVVGTPTVFANYVGTGKATAAGLAAGPDGLYFTDLYKDQNAATPIDPGANVLRIKFVGLVDFSASQTRSSSAPLNVAFTDFSDVPGARSWTWDFGDGGSSTLQHPSHIYQAEGTYNVTLSVLGDNGRVQKTKVGLIQVGCNAFIQGVDARALVSIEAEDFASIVGGTTGHRWEEIHEEGAVDPASGDHAMVAQPNIGTNFSQPPFAADSPRLDYPVLFKRTGTHYVWIRGKALADSDDSIHIGLDGNEIASSDRITGFPQNGLYSWANATMDGVRPSFDVPTLGVHTLNAWMREDGFTFDKIVLTADPGFTPTGLGPDASGLCTDSTIGSLIALWNCNEAAGTTAAALNDSFYNATLVGGPAWVAGVSGTALELDAPGEHLTIANSPLRVGSEWTVALWVKRNDASTANSVMLAGATMELRLGQSGTPGVGIMEIGSGYHAFDYVLPVDTWVHLGFVRTSASISLYVDGLKRQTLPLDLDLDVATIGLASAATLNGSLDDIRIYGRDLGSAEVADLVVTVDGFVCTDLTISQRGDLTDDCRITLPDITLLAANWLNCVGSELNLFGRCEMMWDDFSVLHGNWQDCRRYPECTSVLP